MVTKTFRPRMLGCVLATLTITVSRQPKPGHAPKRFGPHDLVTPVHGFENRVFHLVLGPGHRSLTGGGKKYQFCIVICLKTHDCVG